jgi:hypothetical protein
MTTREINPFYAGTRSPTPEEIAGRLRQEDSVIEDDWRITEL